MGYKYNFMDNHFVRTNGQEMEMPQLMWHITNLCGLNCKFCFSIKNEDEVNIKDLSKYIKKFKDLKVQKIDLSGGEPMLYDFLPEICEALYEAGIYITLTTRAVGLESNTTWILNNLSKFARIIISLDVPSINAFEELSGNKEVWHKTQYLLQQLKDVQYRFARVNTVVTRYLLDDSMLDQLADMVAQYDCKEWCLIETHPANKKDTYDQVKVSHDQFLSIVERAKKICSETTGCRLLVREQTNYADYWVLYPDGTLSKHTDGEKDDYEIPFLNTPGNDILYMIKNKIWLPEGKCMIYRISNVEHDDFVAGLLEELEYEINNGDNEHLSLKNIENSDSKTKGLEIQELVIQIANWYTANESAIKGTLFALAQSGLYDIIKSIVLRLRNTPEYSSEKKIEIVQEDSEGNKTSIIITMREIIDKDGK